MLTNPNYTPTELQLGDATLLVADQGDLKFEGLSGNEWIFTDGSNSDNYIPVDRHVLPADAALPLLDRTDRWACPPASKFEEVRAMLEASSNVGEIEKPGWERIRHIVGLHLGLDQPANTPHPETNIKWWQENAGSNLGYTRKRGWYFGVMPGRDGNGWSNNHYNRLFWLTVALCYEDDQAKREEAWPFFLQQAVAYTCFGRPWSGPWKGFSRDEKGQTYIGDSGRFPYEKDWVTNLVGPYLLTGQELFRAALVNAAEFYVQSTYKWGGAWGSRIPARILENMLQLHMVLPEYRWALEQQMQIYLTILAQTLGMLDYWPNLGNRGQGPISPWMQSEAVAVILRVREQVPWLVSLPIGRLEAIMSRMMDTTRGTDGGSEMVGGYACLRYRMINNTGEPMNARFLSNTAFALPALRMLAGHGYLQAEYESTKALVQQFAGSTVGDVATDTPVPLGRIGYRFPREGPAWPKTMCNWMEALR